MASINDTAATSALNEEDYINQLYDANLKNQNSVLEGNLSDNSAVLDQEQQIIRQQTGEYIDRTGVEAQKAANLYGDGGLSGGAQAQVGLTRENAQRRNVNTLRQAQEDADAEFQRQRQLLASQYETDIKKAQADNDMERAQALYEAAKAEEAQLRELQRRGAELLKKKTGSMRLYDAIANGETPEQDTTSQTWEEVLKNEEALNALYDAQLESQLLELKNQHEAGMSDLEAKRQAREQQTDEKLTDAYVASLRNAKNSSEMQGAYGSGSGAAVQGQLARDVELQDTLTELRRLHMGAEADAGLEALGLSQAYGKGKQNARAETDSQRAKALYEAAEAEEQALIEDQLFVGEARGKKGDYGMLGLLYGLTPEEVRKMKKKPSTQTNAAPQAEEEEPPVEETPGLSWEDFWGLHGYNW